jgi:integrase
MAPGGRSKATKIKAGDFAAVIRAYMTSHKFLSYSANTRASWGRELLLAERQDVLGAISTDVIRPALIQRFLDALVDRPGKQAMARTALKALEKWAVVRDLLPGPIMLGTEAPGSRGGHYPWTDAQVELAERCARQDISRIITLGANTGQRGSDLIRMTWADIETYQGRVGINVVQQKTKKRLWIPLTQPLEEALRGWQRGLDNLGPLIGHIHTRKALSTLWWRERAVNPALKPLADAGLVLHGLRATACVRLSQAGANTRQIADMVGMSEQIVGRYCRLSIQRENALAAVILLDRTRTERHDPRSVLSKD